MDMRQLLFVLAWWLQASDGFRVDTSGRTSVSNREQSSPTLHLVGDGKQGHNSPVKALALLLLAGDQARAFNMRSPGRLFQARPGSVTDRYSRVLSMQESARGDDDDDGQSVQAQQPGMTFTRSGFVRSALAGAMALGGDSLSAQAQDQGRAQDQEALKAWTRSSVDAVRKEPRDGLREGTSGKLSMSKRESNSPTTLASGEVASGSQESAALPKEASATLPKEVQCGKLILQNLKFVGEGVQAQVFSAEIAGKGAVKKVVVLKVSKLSNDYAKKTFSRESRVLRQLEAAGVPNVIRCLEEGKVVIDGIARSGLVLTPFLAQAEQISVKNRRVIPPDQSGVDVERLRQLLKTAVRTLDAGIAGVDVQVLQQQGSGKQLWIDFTEAAILSPVDGGSDQGEGPSEQKGVILQLEAPVAICPEYEERYKNVKAAVLGFATEVFLLIPPSSRTAAAGILAEELCELAASDVVRGPGKELQKVWGFLPWGEEQTAQSKLLSVGQCAATAAGKRPFSDQSSLQGKVEPSGER